MMLASDFSTSRAISKDGFTYIAIAEHCDRLSPNWAPVREVAWELNQMLCNYLVDATECQEGIFESTIGGPELTSMLWHLGFVYNPVLDEAINDFIKDHEQ